MVKVITEKLHAGPTPTERSRLILFSGCYFESDTICQAADYASGRWSSLRVPFAFRSETAVGVAATDSTALFRYHGAHAASDIRSLGCVVATKVSDHLAETREQMVRRQNISLNSFCALRRCPRPAADAPIM